MDVMDEHEQPPFSLHLTSSHPDDNKVRATMIITFSSHQITWYFAIFARVCEISFPATFCDVDTTVLNVHLGLPASQSTVRHHNANGLAIATCFDIRLTWPTKIPDRFKYHEVPPSGHPRLRYGIRPTQSYLLTDNVPVYNDAMDFIVCNDPVACTISFMSDSSQYKYHCLDCSSVPIFLVVRTKKQVRT